MRVTVFSEVRCALDASGAVSTHNGMRTFPFWQRYLDVFSEVRVAARLSRETSAGGPVTGPGVSFLPLPTYSGPLQYLSVRPALASAIRSACEDDSAFIFRVPSRLGVLAARTLQRLGKPYGIEVVGDPHDVFAPGAVRHPLRPFLRLLLASDLRTVAARASAALYVTENALQRRYPCAALMMGASDVDLNRAALAKTWKRPRRGQRSFRIVTVGSLAQLYKGQDALLAAIALCVQRGLDITLVFVGDGRYRAKLEAEARRLGIGERTVFTGRLPAGAAVRRQLDAADLFLLPSRADGLPRALIEAMARGLPCLASRIGGIPELLAEEDLLVPADVQQTAAQIEATLRQPERRARMARRNLARARDFTEEKLIGRRREFYDEVQRRTASAS
jgi:glycosyltransferase involved in cell wall biosynthesis